jgi:hypothetical protein
MQRPAATRADPAENLVMHLICHAPMVAQAVLNPG